jgi:hypothetical protein
LNRRPDATARPRNAARHRLLTAAPVPLERLHFVLQRFGEFVESSLALFCSESPPTVKFWILQKQKPIYRRF